MGCILGATIEIDGVVWKLNAEQYEAYTAANSAFQKARIARDKAIGEPVLYPKGVCNFWILNVRLIRDGNQYIPSGTVGDLNVIETGVDRQIIYALFHPVGSKGFGEVIRPHFERIR